jgi:hypothetical protein
MSEEIKVIEGVRFTKGDTLVVVLPAGMRRDHINNLMDHVKSLDLNIVLLPYGSQILKQEAVQQGEGK